MTLEIEKIFQEATDALEHARTHPHGPTITGESRTVAGNACVTLCNGDADKGRTLWKLIAADLGYMPYAAGVALVRAANTLNLVPDVEAPDPS